MQPSLSQEGATVHSARAVAQDVLTQQAEALGVAQPNLSSVLRFALWQCDHLNNVTGAAERGSRQLKASLDCTVAAPCNNAVCV